MCCISMGSCKQPQEIPWALAKMQIPAPPARVSCQSLWEQGLRICFHTSQWP